MVEATATRPFKIFDDETGNIIEVTGLTIKEIIDIRLKQQLIAAIRGLKR